MSIHIDVTKCVGCGACAEVCPGNLIYIIPSDQASAASGDVKRKVACIRDVRDCWGCTACVKACRKAALSYYLAADIGGAGTRLFAVDDDRTLTWRLEFPDGSKQSIIVDKTQSNQY